MDACSAATLAVRTSEPLSAVASKPLAEPMVAWSRPWDAVAALEPAGETPELRAAPTPVVEDGAEGDGVATLLLATWA
jgi:hypothetical protein